MEKLNKDNYFKCECGMFKMKHTSCLNPANGTCDKEKPFVITEHEYNNINQPASPPSMPGLTDGEIDGIIRKTFPFIENPDWLKCYTIGELVRNRMRSQCEKDVEFSKYVKTALNLGGDTMAIVSDLLRKRNEIFNQQER